MAKAKDTTTAGLAKVLEGPHAEVWRRLRQRLSDPAFALDLGLAPHEQRERVTALMGRLAGDPLVCAGFPERFGGADDVAGFVTGFQGLAYGDLSLLVKVGVQYGLFGGALMQLGTDRHHEEFLRPALDFSLPGCFAMSEVGHGSDVAGVRTTALHDPDTDEIVVHTPDPAAAKNWIGNAANDGKAAVVFCQLTTQGMERGVHAVVVPLRDDAGALLPGVTAVGDGLKMGLNGVDNGLLMFDQVRVPRSNLLDRFAQVASDGTYESLIESPSRRFFTMLGTLVQGRVSIAGAGVAVSKVALTIAVQHSLVRRQFSAPGQDEEVLLMDYTAHQRRLLPLVATTYVLHAAQARLVADLDRVMRGGVDDDERRELETRAAGIKALSTWHATESVQQSREACGGAGYLAAYRLASLKADSDIFTTFEGDNTVLLQLVAKNLLVGFRGELESMDMLDTVRMVVEQAGEQVMERTGVRALLQRLTGVLPGRDDTEDLRDHDVQLSLLAWREEHLLMSVLARMRKRAGEGMEGFAIFDAVQDHALVAGRAFVERIAHECAGDLLDAAEGEAVELLTAVVSLHGVRLLERERGWYVEHGRLAAARTKVLPALVTQLSHELRPHAERLVDAFGIPPAMLVDPAVVARHVTGKGPLDRSSVPDIPVDPASS
jgi:acyl-CoA oxidase